MKRYGPSWAFSSGFKWGDLHEGMIISNFIFQLKQVTSTYFPFFFCSNYSDIVKSLLKNIRILVSLSFEEITLF